MSTDVFGSTAAIGNGWDIDGAVMHLGDGNNLVAIGVKIQYGRQLQTINPINKAEKLIIAGDAEGTVSIQAIVGPSSGLKGFLSKYSGLCELSEKTITITPSGGKLCKGSTTPVSFACSGCSLASVSLDVQKTGGGNMVMTGLTLKILGLSIDGK